MKESATIVVKNAMIITMDRHRTILKNAAIVIDEKTIAYVGSSESVAAKFSAEEQLDAKGMVILPGLINCHTHTLQCLTKGFGEDMRLLDWLEKFMLPVRRASTERSNRVGATHSCIESIHSGVTCLVDNILPNASESMVDGIADSYRRAGVRALIARPIRLGSGIRAEGPDISEQGEKELNITERIVAKWRQQNDDLISVCPSPSAIMRVSPEVLEGCKAISQKYDVPIHSHIAEVPEEVEFTFNKYGRREIELLGHMGILGPKFQAAHSIWLSDGELDMLAGAKANVVHCPISNMYVRSGIAKIPQMMQKGVNISLGSDGGCVGSAHNMLEVMKFASLLHKVNPHGWSKITPMNVIEMATINAARAIGREDDLGSIEVGKKADLFLMDLSNAHSMPVHNVVASIVFYSYPSDVKTVIINGRVVMRDGSIRTIEEAKALEETAHEAEKLISRAGLMRPSF